MILYMASNRLSSVVSNFLLMEQIAKTLHPDLFGDLDMVREVKDYFAEFYGCPISDREAEYVLTFKGPDGQ